MDFTLTELCERYNLSESVVKKNFPRVVKKILKEYGSALTKTGRGKNVVYHIEEQDYSRARTVYEEKDREICMLEEDLLFKDYEFLLFITLSATSNKCFRGEYCEYLDYIEKPRTAANKEKLKKAKDVLIEKNIVLWTEDPNNKEFFVAGLSQRGGEMYSLSSARIKRCREIAKKHKKRDWYNLFKVYSFIRMAGDDVEYFTAKRIGKMLNLSEPQVRTALNILQKEHLIKAETVYKKIDTQKAEELLRKFYCLGTKIDINSWYEDE